MNSILRYIKQYWNLTNKPYLLIVTVFTALLIWWNYNFHIEYHFSNYTGIQRWLAFTILYCLSYGTPFLLHQILCSERVRTIISSAASHINNSKPDIGSSQAFPDGTTEQPDEHLTKRSYFKIYGFVLACAALFSFKASSTLILEKLRLVFNTTNSGYWAIIFNTPIKLLCVWFFTHLIWNLLQPTGAYLGLKLPARKDGRSYLYMFLFMVPLVWIAASLPSFLTYYPKFQSILSINEPTDWWKIIIYELSYASDFITIELFFRGLLVAGMIKLAGPMVIIPMAAFYCSIHFGKPMGECISSYFGGLFLGVLTWRTNSIAGGLILHIGIAWLMEIAGVFY